MNPADSINTSASRGDTLRVERDDLNKNLTDLLQRFERETGLKVEGVEIVRALNGNGHVRTDVKL